MEPCTSAGQVTVPTNSTAKDITGLETTLVKKVECDGDLNWLSGEPVRIVQCKGAAWTPVLDVCEDGELVD